jgi:hypothetical protein
MRRIAIVMAVLLLRSSSVPAGTRSPIILGVVSQDSVDFEKLICPCVFYFGTNIAGKIGIVVD